MKDKVIMYESDEAAWRTTKEGWINQNGFFHTDERIVRYDGSTHKQCDCGNVISKMYTRCESCQAKASAIVYEKSPFKEWDGETPLVLFDDDKYFFDEDDIHAYCEDNDCSVSDLRLMICVPNYLSHVSSDYWDEVLPMDSGGDLPKEIEEALNALNAAIDKQGPISWQAGHYRTKVATKETDNENRL